MSKKTCLKEITEMHVFMIFFSIVRQAKYVDILCINHYYAWYSDPGLTELIRRQVRYDLTNWHKTFRKPVIMSEYGADTIAGFHQVSHTSECPHENSKVVSWLEHWA